MPLSNLATFGNDYMTLVIGNVVTKDHLQLTTICRSNCVIMLWRSNAKWTANSEFSIAPGLGHQAFETCPKTTGVRKPSHIDASGSAAFTDDILFLFNFRSHRKSVANEDRVTRLQIVVLGVQMFSQAGPDLVCGHMILQTYADPLRCNHIGNQILLRTTR